jgi:hypothetical protein
VWRGLRTRPVRCRPLTRALVRQARTAAIVGANGKPSAGSVAELIREGIGGHDLAVLIRGAVATKPVLLFLAGGPGGTETGAMRRHGQGLEQDFVVATFDQRGSGKSYDNLEPPRLSPLRRRSATRSRSPIISVTSSTRKDLCRRQLETVLRETPPNADGSPPATLEGRRSLARGHNGTVPRDRHG